VNRRYLLVASLILNVVLVALLVYRRPASVEETGTSEAAEPAAATPSVPDAPAAEPVPALTGSPRVAVPARPRTARGNRPGAASETAAAPAASAPGPAADVTMLRSESDVPGAQVFIDRRFLGVTPLTVSDVKPGSHQLNASVDGFEGVANTIDVTAGNQQVMIRFREVKLDAHADVVHKHRIGSCKGQLIATAEGLRYETADRDDAFTVALVDIDQFDLNYQEKNLRIRLKKGGKSYNFTDPEGKADRLFVLHRDVERAREKLKAGGIPATN
jgi:hypothetical protein